MPRIPGPTTKKLGILDRPLQAPQQGDSGAAGSFSEQGLAGRHLRLAYGKPTQGNPGSFDFLEIGPTPNMANLVPLLVLLSGGAGFTALVGNGDSYPAEASFSAVLASSLGGAVSTFGYSDTAEDAGFAGGQFFNVVSALNGVRKALLPQENDSHDIGMPDDRGNLYWRNLYLSGDIFLDGVAITPIPASAPTDADYLVGTANAGLSAEIVVGTTPGGELGGTWASPTVDALHAGNYHPSSSRNSANQTSTTTTLANATLISFAVGAGEVWAFHAVVFFGTELQTSGLIFDWTQPGGGGGRYAYVLHSELTDTAPELVGSEATMGNDKTIAAAAFGADDAILIMHGTFTATNAGTHQFRFARAEAAGTCTLKSNSHIVAYRVS